MLFLSSTRKFAQTAAALIALIASQFAYAESVSCDDAEHCIEVDSWHIAVALGAGIKLSPLVDGDNFPLIVVPDIAYYGDNWYWDNYEAGYQRHSNDPWSAEAFIRVNSERSLFSYWHTENLLTAPLDGIAAVTEGGRSQDPPPPETIIGIPDDNPGDSYAGKIPTTPISIDNIAERDWALDAGIRIHYLQEQSEWSLTLLTDVSGVHDGQQLQIDYQRLYQVGNWQILPTLSLTWKSSDLTDYYYGLDVRDGLIPSRFYEGKSGWQPSMKIVASKPISKDWNWLVMANYQHLHDGMRRSPIVRRNSIITAFAGVTYRF